MTMRLAVPLNLMNVVLQCVYGLSFLSVNTCWMKWLSCHLLTKVKLGSLEVDSCLEPSGPNGLTSMWIHCCTNKVSQLPFVGEELCVDSRVWPHLSQQVTVEDLEHFIEAKLAESLHGVADESGSPTLRQASEAIFPHSHFKAVTNTLVFVRAHLERWKQCEEAWQITAALRSGVPSWYLDYRMTRHYQWFSF